MRAALLCLPLFLSLLPASPAPHGGVYRGPGATVPPGAGPGGPSTPVGPGGAAITDWQVWWSFHRDPYLQLKRAIHADGTATGDDAFFLGFGQQRAERPRGVPDGPLRRVVVPELFDTLAAARNPDLVTACLLALAKIGLDAEDGREVEPVLRTYLRDDHQEIAESAAVALGVLGEARSAPPLAALLRDDERGRRLVGREKVPRRTRAFAAYALGLIGRGSGREEVRRYAVFHLAQGLAHRRSPSSDVPVACALSIGLVPLPVRGEWPEAVVEPLRPGTSRETQIAWLLRWFTTARADDAVRVHAPVALARLCAGAGERARSEVARFLLLVLVDFGRERRDVRRAAVIALGLLGDDDGDELDARIRDRLRKLAGDQDAMTRDLARIALARVVTRPGPGPGAEGALAEARRWLLRDLAGGRSTARAWTALALGVMEHRRLARGEGPSGEVRLALRSVLAEGRNPRDVGALCTALGLARDDSAEPLLRATLTGPADQAARAQAAIGLGMVRARASTEALRELALRSLRRPDLLLESSTALALLGDREIQRELVAALPRAKTLATQAALAGAIGRIGDDRALDPLLEVLRDPAASVTARAWVVASLGSVGDRRSLPWNSSLAVDAYVGLPTETLTDGIRGVLDLL